jgi:hypothetical protein
MVETVMCRYQKQTARESVTTENKGSYPQIIVLQRKWILIKEPGYIERPQSSRDVTLLPYGIMLILGRNLDVIQSKNVENFTTNMLLLFVDRQYV